MSAQLQSGSSAAPGSSSEDIGLFFKGPKNLYGSGLAARIGYLATGLYTCLCECASRNRTPGPFSRSDKALSIETAISIATIRRVRGLLVKVGLIAVKHKPGGSIEYELLPQRLPWVKLDDRPNRKPQTRAPRTRPKSETALRVSAPHISVIAADHTHGERSPVSEGTHPGITVGDPRRFFFPGCKEEVLCTGDVHATTDEYIEGIL